MRAKAKQFSETGATHVALYDDIGDNLTCHPELDATHVALCDNIGYNLTCHPELAPTHVTTCVNLNKDCATSAQ